MMVQTYIFLTKNTRFVFYFVDNKINKIRIIGQRVKDITGNPIEVKLFYDRFIQR